MKSLLLIAHGSRVRESNDEVAAVCDKLRAQLRDQLRGRGQSAFEHVDYAFLELASPSIPEGVAQCVKAGASEVLVLPYFLSAGKHIRDDIPSEIAKCKHPGVVIRVCDYVGDAKGMIELLAQLATDA